MRKGLAVAAAAALLLTACGREGTPKDVAAFSDASPSPTATAKAARGAKASATPAATQDAPAATSEPAAPQAPAATSGPQQTAAPGTQQPPKDGRYTYDFKGKANDPTNPTASQQSFEGERYSQVSHNGSSYTIVTTNSEESTRVTTKLNWGQDKVELTSIAIQTQLGEFSCAFDPPLVIVRFPIKPETYPTQNFKGQGNACDGKLDITVERQEAAQDATGRSWNAWRVKVRTETRSESFDLTTDETRWVSPDLGMEVRSEAKSNGSFKSGAFSGDIAGESTSVLRSHP